MATSSAHNLLGTIRTIHIIGHQIDNVLDGLLRDEFDLTISRFRILLPLIERGPSTQSEIARFNLVTEASIARQVRLLVEEGYLEQVPCKVDARKCYLTLTKKTKQLVPKITARLQSELQTLYAALSTADAVALDTVLTKMLTLGAHATSDDIICNS